MRAAVLVVAVLALVAAAHAAEFTDFEVDLKFSQFLDFTKQFSKQYASMEEFLVRFENFKASQARIERMSKSNPYARFAINQFSDMSVAEFKQKMLGSVPPKQETLPAHHVKRPRHQTAVTKFDWRDHKGVVSAVKDQQQCGSCWAFSATEAIESSWNIAKKLTTSVVLSPQQIVSCDTQDSGCGGGWPYLAYEYIESAGGQETDAAYPYTSGGGDSGVCKFDASKIAVKISGMHYATPPCNDSCSNQDEDTMATNLVNQGPASVCVYAESWMDYAGGVFSDASQCPSDYSSLDHCVQLVGFNKESSPNYWIVRNSWNTGWGVQGYIYIAMGSNLCGIADQATIVDI